MFYKRIDEIRTESLKNGLLRRAATAATTIPNMVRGTVILMTFGFNQLKAMHFSVLMAAGIIGFIAFAIGIYATLTIKETHGIDLDYLEED